LARNDLSGEVNSGQNLNPLDHESNLFIHFLIDQFFLPGSTEI
jgi:hypothetical protein